jgi:hypothetical protein
MSADLDVLVALLPFAGHLGLVLDEAAQTSLYDSEKRLVAQTTQVQAVR